MAAAEIGAVGRFDRVVTDGKPLFPTISASGVGPYRNAVDRRFAEALIARWGRHAIIDFEAKIGRSDIAHDLPCFCGKN